MPGRELRNAPPSTGIDIYSLHAVRPVDKCDFASAADPAFMRDPLLIVLPAPQPAIARAIAIDEPQAVREWPGIENQIGIIGTELRMTDRVTLEDDMARS